MVVSSLPQRWSSTSKGESTSLNSWGVRTCQDQWISWRHWILLKGFSLDVTMSDHISKKHEDLTGFQMIYGVQYTSLLELCLVFPPPNQQRSSNLARTQCICAHQLVALQSKGQQKYRKPPSTSSSERHLQHLPLLFSVQNLVTAMKHLHVVSLLVPWYLQKLRPCQLLLNSLLLSFAHVYQSQSSKTNKYMWFVIKIAKLSHLRYFIAIALPSQIGQVALRANGRPSQHRHRRPRPQGQSVGRSPAYSTMIARFRFGDISRCYSHLENVGA